MPAIACGLGETLDLLPDGVAGKALSLKVVNDANDVIDERAPAVAGLTRCLAAEPPLANPARVSREQFGDSHCGGEIEKSMRQVINKGSRHA